MKRYKLTDEQIIYSGKTLSRIQALTNFGDILSGDSGGYVETLRNLSDEGWIYDNAKVFGNALVSGKAKAYDNSEMSQQSVISGNAEIHDNVKMLGKTKLDGTAKLFGNIIIDAKIEINDDSWTGITQFNGSRHWAYQESKDTITIGCESGTIAHWVTNVRTIAEENNYTPEEVDEYEAYVQAFANLYN